MPNLSHYIGEVPAHDGQRIIFRIVTEAEYMRIAAVSGASPNTGSADYDEYFAHTIYYITENPTT